MRKLRVNIYDDDVAILKLLKNIMSLRDYEVVTFEGAVDCPIYKTETNRCNSSKPCADVIITDYKMPQTTGLAMLLQQAQRGCKVDVRNKLVLSAGLDDEGQKMLKEMGCAFVSKPFTISAILDWLDGCEKRIDLSKPLGGIRKEDRYPASIDIEYTSTFADKIYKATVINYSSSGLCLKVATPLAEGQSIAIKTELPIDCQSAFVCWAKTMGHNCSMTGCSCG